MSDYAYDIILGLLDAAVILAVLYGIATFAGRVA